MQTRHVSRILGFWLHRFGTLTTVLLIAGLGVSPAGAQEIIEVDAPDALLDGVPFSITVRTPGSLDTLQSTLRGADGTVLHGALIPPVGEVVIPDLVVTDRDQLPLELTVGSVSETISRPFIPAWFSILPPLMAIALALIIREVVSSLFLGIWLGCLFLAGYNPFAAVLMAIDRFVQPALANPDHAAIVIFSLLLGGMVGVMTRMGGTKAIVEAVTPLATSPRRAQLATWLAGLAIFFDDYANTLLVGNTMRPLTDKLKVSREKLAYIVDSTAAPVAAIVFVSTWVGYEISLIGDGMHLAVEQGVADGAVASQLMTASPFAVFIRSIPYLFYPIMAIFAVALFVLSRRDFGPMLAAERRAASGAGVYRAGAQLAADMDSELGTVPDGTPLRWWNGVIPILTVVVTVVAGLVWTGTRGLGELDPAPSGFAETVRHVLNNADPFATLLWGSLLGCVVGIVLAAAQRLLTLSQAVSAMVSGMRAMMLAMMILVLAWSLGAVTSSLSTASFLASILSERLPLELLPVTVFVVAALMAFATGTSWATMAIMLPLIVPLSVGLGAGLGGGASTGAFLGAIASVLAGAIFGDHCSPISDTTVLSSMASGCDHVDHVRTQLPYAVLVAVIAAVALVIGSTVFGSSPWAALALIVLGCGVIYLFVRFVGGWSQRPAAVRATR
ncbi:MAG: Na+/H+ antiporter NhaC family protein [Gemmatimonadales bacterium]|nr:Na+/H+ antiporter NhaC family protein [Gemmatimonadales bacterium]NIN10969.1 Na+/H+ antiporter NhaC family protein [Gemmatimonadales bacterium]NIN49561.1 Na+/H+ antiporter NhaC family protein [Gemmatimonadales bacterium]NIP07025.1 Na+/H+ antiporter NhaC family protein [Gemmatimonadales bacterium]NIR01659.1 Na+/H+ antiporter NhaC family protein [Gemmatimonadales bacterium]